VIAVNAVRPHRVVLVEIEGHDVGEVEAFVAVHLDQLALDTNWCTAGGEAEHSASTFSPPFLDDVGDALGDRAGDFVVLDDY